MKTGIETIQAVEILDSRGNPTVEVEIVAANGIAAKASVPSGASTGSREAVELRDGDPLRYAGRGVLKAVGAVNGEIAAALRGFDYRDQAGLDAALIALDGTANKSRLGANALLGVSMAAARLAAESCAKPLFAHLCGDEEPLMPVPCMNVLNGGVHARWQGSDFQEFMIAPVGAPTLAEAVRWGSEIYQALRRVLQEAGVSVGVGDEGGFAPHVISNRQPLEWLMKAVSRAGYEPGSDVVFCLDPASSEFFSEGRYQLNAEKRSLSAAEMTAYYAGLIREFPIASIEDGLAEDDWAGWGYLRENLGDRVELVGDDLFVTNVTYIERGIRENAANSALIKLNQIGTVSETLAAIRLCLSRGWGAFISHRSGETIDTFIADLAAGTRAGKIKAGAPCRGERVEKYNRLMSIERALKTPAYAGRRAFLGL